MRTKFDIYVFIIKQMKMQQCNFEFKAKSQFQICINVKSLLYFGGS